MILKRINLFCLFISTFAISLISVTNHSSTPTPIADLFNVECNDDGVDENNLIPNGDYEIVVPSITCWLDSWTRYG